MDVSDSDSDAAPKPKLKRGASPAGSDGELSFPLEGKYKDHDDKRK